MGYLHESQTEALNGFGWSTQLRRTTPAVVVAGRTIVPSRTVTIGQEGHEIITRDAIGTGVIPFVVAGAPTSHTLTSTDIADIILGNRSVDLGVHDADDSGAGVRAVLNYDEQKRHSLRRELGQSTAAALADIRAEFGRQHSAILRETDPRRRMRRIGVIIHLIQDSYSPAHTERDPSNNWCINYVRNYGRGSAPREHGTPSDARDSVTNLASVTARARATMATRRYLQIVLKALRGGAAGVEASMEIGTFMLEVFRGC